MNLWPTSVNVKTHNSTVHVGLPMLKVNVNNIQLTDLGVLKRQLMGIDTIFLKELTDDLAAKGETKYDFLEAIDMISAFVDNE